MLSFTLYFELDRMVYPKGSERNTVDLYLLDTKQNEQQETLRRILGLRLDRR